MKREGERGGGRMLSVGGLRLATRSGQASSAEQRSLLHRRRMMPQSELAEAERVRLFVGGIAQSADETAVQQMMEKAAKRTKLEGVLVEDVFVARRNGSVSAKDGFAFVTVAPGHAAIACIKTYNGCRWKNGATLRVEAVKDNPFCLTRESDDLHEQEQLVIRSLVPPMPLFDDTATLTVSRKRGRRGRVQVKPKSPIEFSSDDEDYNGPFTIDLSEHSAPVPKWKRDLETRKSNYNTEHALAGPRSAEMEKELDALSSVDDNVSQVTNSSDGENDQLDEEKSRSLSLLASVLEPSSGEETKRGADVTVSFDESLIDKVKEQEQEQDSFSSPEKKDHQADEKMGQSSSIAKEQTKKASLRTIFENVFENRQEASSFSFLGGEEESGDKDSGAKKLPGGATLATTAHPSVSDAGKASGKLMPVKLGDILRTVNEKAIERWPRGFARKFVRQQDAESQWLDSRTALSKDFTKKMKRALKQGLGNQNAAH